MNALSPPDPPPVLPPVLGGGSVTYVVHPAPGPVRWRDRPLLLLAGAAIAVFAASFGLAPWLTCHALSSAARYDDPAALAQLVDYDAVRASLAPQLADPQGARTAPPPPNLLTDPLRALRDAFAPRLWSPSAPPAPSPDSYLSPNGLLTILAGKAQARRTPQPAPPGLATPTPHLVFFGGHRVRFLIRDPADRRRETVIMLGRDKAWFRWRLVGVVLPQATP